VLSHLLDKRFLILDAVVIGTMIGGRHGKQENTLGEEDQVTSIHGRSFLSSVVQARSFPAGY
jgi:hypothetical protein